jgi:exosortase D (VPLPA-CTERM-specific)
VVVYRFSVRGAALVAATLALLCAPFWNALGWLWSIWMERPEYSHGPLLPFVAAFLAWQQKDRLERLPFAGSWWGPALLVVASVMYLLGVLGSVYTLQQYGLVVAVAGVALALTGGAAFSLLTVPLLVLVLMIPQPQFILANLSSQLQLLSSWLGVQVIRALDIPVYLQGNVIDLGVYKLQVIEACDGLRYLFPLMALALLFAFFYKGALWKRVLIFLASVPIAILMNSLRVGSIGVMVAHWGVGMAEGFLHEFQGWAVFMASAALLLGLTAALNRVGTESGTWRQLFGLEFPAPTPATATIRERALPPAFHGAMVVVAALVLASSILTARGEYSPAREPFAVFPLQLGDWRGSREVLEPDVLDALALDDYVIANYRRADGAVASVYLAYYASQRDRRTAHSPRSCIPGDGWRIESLTQIELGGSGGRANRMVIARGDVRELVYYWFRQRGRTITNEYAVKWYLFWDSIVRQRSDGALVRLIAPIGPQEDVELADRRLSELAATLRPVIPRFVPD